MRQTRANNERGHDFDGTQLSGSPRQPRTVSTARDGWPIRRSFARPLCLALLLTFLDRLFQLTDVVECQFSRLSELRHHRLGPPAEETQNLVEEPVPRDVSSDHRLKDVGIADFPHPTHRVLPLQPIDGGLDGGVGGTRFRKGLLNLPNRCVPTDPEGFEDLKFEPREFRLSHINLLSSVEIYYGIVGSSRGIFRQSNRALYGPFGWLIVTRPTSCKGRSTSWCCKRWRRSVLCTLMPSPRDSNKSHRARSV